MSTQKKKFELFARLGNLGFTFEESVALRRIEMTLRSWGTAECNGEIETDDNGKAFRVGSYENSINGRRPRYSIANREAGALKRLKAIVDARNAREFKGAGISALASAFPDFLIPYHQTDPRGCAVYLVKRSDLEKPRDWIAKKVGQSSAELLPIEAYYNRGLAVCA